MSITLEQVVKTDETVLRAQRVLASAPQYERLVSGQSVSSRAGHEFFDELPPGKSLVDKSNFILRWKDQDVGVADCIRGWRERGFAHIGLYLIDERFHGLGIGRAGMQALQQWFVSHWPETHSLRIGVIENNFSALAFWQKLGFVDTGERRDNGFLAPAVVMLKPL